MPPSHSASAPRKRRAAGVFTLILAMALAVTVTVFQPPPAHAQTVSPATVTISSEQTSVYEGQGLTYTLTRDGGTVGDELTVVLDTYEVGNYTATLAEHSVTFPPGGTSADLTVLVPADGDSEPGTNTFVAEVRCLASLPYSCGSQWSVEVEIDDPPRGSQFVGVSASSTSVIEGQLHHPHLHPHRRERHPGPDGEHPGERPRRQAPGQSLGTSARYPNPGGHPIGVDHRGHNARLSRRPAGPVRNSSHRGEHPPLESYFIDRRVAGVTISTEDNDTAQGLELHFGKDGVNDDDADEGDTLKFIVKRRQSDADTGQTAAFTVRVETDRSGVDRLLEDWIEDASTGRLFKDFPSS